MNGNFQQKRYPENSLKFQKTDSSPLKRAQEIIREKIFKYVFQEIPYIVIQRNLAWTDFDGGVRIDEEIYVKKEGQRMILLGKEGNLLKKIISEASQEISDFLQKQVQLNVSVKIGRPNDLAEFS